MGAACGRDRRWAFYPCPITSGSPEKCQGRLTPKLRSLPYNAARATDVTKIVGGKGAALAASEGFGTLFGKPLCWL